jgi:sugar O-acyltransferase (sialic acid O-acetyltransferase NeuD family)
MSCLLVIGAGGHGKVVAETALASGQWTDIAFLDGRFPELSEALGWPVVGSDAEPRSFLSRYPHAFVAIGDNRSRVLRITELLDMGYQILTVVHPTACVSPTAKLGVGTIVVAAAVVNACSKLGRGCIVNTGATVDHDCTLGDGVHISPGAHVGGEVTIGARSWIGIGAAIRHCIKIGKDVVVGAGAAVARDLPSRVTAVGVPARVIKMREPC